MTSLRPLLRRHRSHEFSHAGLLRTSQPPRLRPSPRLLVSNTTTNVNNDSRQEFSLTDAMKSPKLVSSPMTSPSPHPKHLSLTRFPSTWIPLSSTHPLGSSVLRNHLEPTQRVFLDPQKGVKYLWKSRGHRKGCVVEVQEDRETNDGEVEKGIVCKPEKVAQTRWWGCDYWDISWWVAADQNPFLGTLGSIWWCLNGVLFFCYFSRTSPSYTNTEAATAFLGGSTFLVGSYLGWVESLNPARDADFGFEVDELRGMLREPPTNSHHSLGRKRHHFGRHLLHHQREHQPPQLRHRLANPHSPSPSPSQSLSRTSTLISSPASTTSPPSPSDSSPPWRWYGTTPTLAYIANSVQLFGSITFFLSVLCGLPGILPLSGQTGGPDQSSKSEGLWIGLYWGMQILGAPCFMFAGMVFALETQDKWWKLKVGDVGWQVGFWNFWGGAGFFLSPIFGIYRQTSISDPSKFQYWGTAFSTFLGSWFFLIGS
ncbi:BQ2448_7187 [Microbotryum intermedium]|uniref:BQ2448_7187 protein n=1 Tax=Microbotryum intermedium TaxID=269621 RepID=A0A238FHH7_9BASI|nr:BQ2448_7187 [Microbotryum intermedium]